MHQCLRCGATYTDMSELENGRRMCAGRKFYFADEPLNDEARRSVDERRPQGIAKIIVDENRLQRWMEAKVEDTGERRGIIEIKGKGSYEIDIEALMESKPIIVEKDGTYLIYLPSLFEKLSRGKK